MPAPFDLSDDSVVVIIGTGAGGGVLANELAQKGIGVVALEAGGRYLPEDYVNDEWESFGQLAWLDPRTTSGDWRVALDFCFRYAKKKGLVVQIATGMNYWTHENEVGFEEENTDFSVWGNADDLAIAACLAVFAAENLTIPTMGTEELHA